ncbi:pyridoxamine 5'-phosphate oxidase family protein, partial [Streptomyces sp. 8ZJF_21]|nr:pyridoxamine 5'-phosphate oxidase family protein [Streptomyces sp. 8ZJF_21]
DPEAVARFAEAVRPPEPFHLFRTEVTEVVHTASENGEMVLRTWRPGRPVQVVRRGSDDSPPRVEG